MENRYVHGYDQREHIRLQDQASTLTDLLHDDTRYGEYIRVLEAGCGVGSQTVTLARNSSLTQFFSVDISALSVFEARAKTAEFGITNVLFQCADILSLPYREESFDHIFLCFVLEHIPDPVNALNVLKKYLKPGGTITVIEGDHGSTYFYPDSEAARRAIGCQVQLQSMAGGNAMIGRELYPLLNQAGYSSVRVSPRMVYVDSSKPGLVEGFTKKTFTAMIEGVREEALEKELIPETDFDQGIKDLYRTSETDGVFCYCFFKALGVN